MELGRGARIGWIDHARGLCVVLVVMLYATEWAHDATGRQGWLDYVAEFARPFRMPDLFLISGLLLSRTIARPWPEYFDRKVLHFAYFYLLWLSIAFLVLGASMAPKDGSQAVQWLYLQAFVRPFYWLWFIYMLPFFFVVTKAGMRVPVALMWTAAAALHVGELQTGMKVLDKFSEYYVFFYTGYAFAPLAFRLASAAAARRRLAFGALALWTALEAYAVFAGYSRLPLLSLVLAFAGIAAVVTAAALMSRSALFAPLRYCGEHSIVIYLAFFAPAMAMRAALMRLGLIDDAGTMGVLVTLAGVLGALMVFWAVRYTRLCFLFERPGWARLTSERSRRPAAVSRAPTSPS